MLYIGSDHRGYKLKEYIKKYLQKKGIAIDDVGTDSEKSVDFPKYAFEVGKNVAKSKINKGIVICGSGVGVTIAANKVKGVRAGFVYDARLAKEARKHDHINVLALGSDRLTQKEATRIVDSWLNESTGKEARYRRRVKQILQYENKK